LRIAALRETEMSGYSGRRRVVVGLSLDPATYALPATYGPESGVEIQQIFCEDY
jgi:hypothetical protein